MSDDSREWRWVGEDGAQKSVSERELVAELSSEALPNYTLVWRKGWAEWLPAMQVAELAWALPAGKADEAVKARESRGDAGPPPPPVYRYTVIKRRAQNLKAEDRPALKRPSIAPPAAPPSPPSEPTAPRSVPPPAPAAARSVPPPAPAAPRSVPPPARPSAAPPPLAKGPTPAPTSAADLEGATLVDEPATPDSFDETEHESEPGEEIVEVDSLLESRPEGASAPDASSGPLGHYGDELDNAETRVVRARAVGGGGPTYVPPHTPPPSEAPSPEQRHGLIDETTDAASDFRFPPPPAAPHDFSEYASGRQLPRWTPRQIYLAVLGSVLLGAGLVSLLTKGGDDAESPAASASAPAPIAPGPAAGTPAPLGAPCGLRKSIMRLAPSAHPGIEPIFAQVPGSARLAVGFGDDDNAFGITIDTQTLDHDQVFRHGKGKVVAAVAPTTGGGRLAFHVNRRGDPLSPATFVNAATPFALGLTGNHIGRQPAGETRAEPTIVWPDAGDAVTTPRTAVVSETGYAVAVRTGGQSGKVRVGWLTTEGAQLSALAEVATDAELVGTPDVAGNDTGALVAFAARRKGETLWGIQTASVPRGSGPRPARWFAVPPGGPGSDSISPLVAGLPAGRWLLVWTEGGAGKRALRMQVLNEDGVATNPPVRVSSEDQNAGQGALWLQGTEGVLLFFVEAGKQHELWGASIQCPT